ncbi:MAG: helix-turn-helix transcriptional regulator [Betaproteobacteria bacterium]|nr:helix-turn-helix transcriptional regulator [Betaproteobacteria bacterium]
MQHWIIDREAVALDNWRAALPRAQVLGREALAGVRFAGDGIIWVRMRFGEPVIQAVSGVDRSGGQPLVVLADDPNERVVLEALAAGAAGCCNSHAAPAVLRQVVLVVGNGGLWVGQSLLTQLVGATTRRLAQLGEVRANDGWTASLSAREAEVARLVAAGAANKEIAARLKITERTVKAHLTAIFEKLGVRDRLQLSLRVNGLKI